ncbi:MAG: succinate--CoA ligase subunit alpha [Planctomycetota bacterium]
MAILVNKNTRVVVQGITGSAGSFHARQMLEYGTEIVAGVTPRKGGQLFFAGGDPVSGRDKPVPIFNTVAEAVRETGANTSVVFVPAAFAIDALREAAESGLNLVVCITEGIPTLDMVKIYKFYKGKGVRLIGPNCPGLTTPGEAKVGIMPGYIHKKGTVGVVSRSGTLTYEAVWQITNQGLGQSTCVGIGGDAIVGMSFSEILELFQSDPETEVIVLIGEIGGTMEEEAAEYIKEHVTKPVIAFIAGQTAPEGKRMGHAGAIISGGAGTAQEKVDKLGSCGITMVANPAEIGQTVAQVMRNYR